MLVAERMQHKCSFVNVKQCTTRPRNVWPTIADVWSQDGQHFMGSIKWCEERKVMSAHCLHRRPGDRVFPHELWGSHGSCRLDRTCRPDVAGEHRGRPLSLLVHWLQQGGCPGCRNRAQHLQASKRVPRATRLQVRSWMEGRPEVFAQALALERPMRVGERREHDKCA